MKAFETESEHLLGGLAGSEDNVDVAEPTFVIAIRASEAFERFGGGAARPRLLPRGLPRGPLSDPRMRGESLEPISFPQLPEETVGGPKDLLLSGKWSPVSHPASPAARAAAGQHLPFGLLRR